MMLLSVICVVIVLVHSSTAQVKSNYNYNNNQYGGGQTSGSSNSLKSNTGIPSTYTVGYDNRKKPAPGSVYQPQKSRSVSQNLVAGSGIQPPYTGPPLQNPFSGSQIQNPFSGAKPQNAYSGFNAVNKAASRPSPNAYPSPSSNYQAQPSKQPVGSYFPIVQNNFNFPTTFRQPEKKEPTDFFKPADPNSNKRDAISSYTLQNNFVDPSSFEIPKEDKYTMIDNIFGGLSGRSSRLDESKKAGDNPYFQGRFEQRPSRFRNLGKGVAVSNPGLGYFAQGQSQGYQSRSDNNKGLKGTDDIGFTVSEKKVYGADQTPVFSNVVQKKLGADSANTYGNPSQQGAQAVLNPKSSNVGLTTGYANKLGSSSSYGNSDGFSQPANDKTTFYQNSKASKFPSGQGYQNNQGFSNLGHRTFDNSYNTKGAAGGSRISGNSGGDLTATFSNSQSRPASYGNLNSFPRTFNTAGSSFGSLSPYQGTGFFEAQASAPLFDGFTPNKPLTLNDFRSRNLLGDPSFGSSGFGQQGFGGQGYFPGSGRSKGNSGFFSTNSAGGSGSKQDSNTKDLLSGNILNNLGSSKTDYVSGNNGLKQLYANTQTSGSGYDNARNNNQGYNNVYDNNEVFARKGGQGDSGNKVSGKLEYADGDEKSNTYQSNSGYQDGGRFTDGDSYSNNFAYSDGKTSGRQLKTQGEDEKNVRTRYEDQNQVDDSKDYNNVDGYNDAYSGGNKYDIKDGYTDQVNYKSEDSDSSQSLYNTQDGYKKGVADVASALSGRSRDPYAGLKTSVTEGLIPGANDKPFNVNGPVFEGEYIL